MSSPKVIKFTFKDEQYEIRPEFKTICAIEDDLSGAGKGMFELAQEMTTGQFKTTHLAIVIWRMINDKNISLDDVGEEIIGNIKDYLIPAAEFISTCAFGSNEVPSSSDDYDGGTEGNE